MVSGANMTVLQDELLRLELYNTAAQFVGAGKRSAGESSPAGHSGRDA